MTVVWVGTLFIDVPFASACLCKFCENVDTTPQEPVYFNQWGGSPVIMISDNIILSDFKLDLPGLCRISYRITEQTWEIIFFILFVCLPCYFGPAAPVRRRPALFGTARRRPRWAVPARYSVQLAARTHWRQAENVSSSFIKQRAVYHYVYILDQQPRSVSSWFECYIKQANTHYQALRGRDVRTILHYQVPGSQVSQYEQLKSQ